MKATKTLLVFCEGAHDVAFVRQVFKFCFGAEHARGVEGEGLKFSEYPAPFNQLNLLPPLELSLGEVIVDECSN